MSGRKQFRFSTLYQFSAYVTQIGRPLFQPALLGHFSAETVLEVLPEHCKQGFGKALFEAVNSWAKENKATWLEWYASPSAIGFYERLGYKGETCPQPENPFYEIEFS